MNKSLIAFFCVLFTIQVTAQDLEEMKKKHKGEFAVNLEMKESIEFSINKNELKVMRRTFEKTMYLSDKVPEVLGSSVTHSSFYNLQNIEARTLVPKGNGKYKSNKVSYFMESSASSQGIFYDDLQAVSFFYQGVQEGAITEVDYTMEIEEPRLMGPGYLQDHYATERMEFSVTFPKEVKITVKEMNKEGFDIQYSESSDGKTTTYTWVLNDIPKMQYESNGPDPRYYMPMIHVILNEVTFPLGTKKYLGDEKDLHQWYRDLIVGYDEGNNNEEVKALVDSITNGLTTDREKVKAIYYWVQDNIKYIAFEDNLSGFIPRPAAKVCSRRFGDCKDMASIIREMCAQAGVEAHLTWIGTRDIPYTYQDVPTASSDNHMIATWFDENGVPIFLDATAKYFEFGVAPYHIQGKEALISISEDEFKVIEVPYADKMYSRVIDTSWVKIEGNDLVARAKEIQTGYNRNMTTYYVINLTDEEQKDYLKRLLQKGNNKFKLGEFEIQNLDSVEKDLVVEYKYSIPGYVQTVGNEMYIDLNLRQRFGKKIDDDRKIPFEYDYKMNDNFVFVLEIPEGYEISYLPDNISDTIDGYNISIQYDVTGNKIIYTLNINIEHLMLYKDSFDDWNKLFVKVNRVFGENIVLKKK